MAHIRCYPKAGRRAPPRPGHRFTPDADKLRVVLTHDPKNRDRNFGQRGKQIFLTPQGPRSHRLDRHRSQNFVADE